MNSLLFEKKQFGYLCSLLKCSPIGLRKMLDSIDEQYREWEEFKMDKATGKNRAYSDGTLKKRVIRPPKSDLKIIQRSINRNVLASIDLLPNVHGGIKGRSNITNAKSHQGKKFVLATDLQDFYPGIKSSTVYGFFLGQGYSKYVAHWLTRLTTWKDQLPQGAPTSSTLANLIFSSIDSKLVELTKEQDITYTRYVDDLTFSSSFDFQQLVPEILKIIIENGFRVNYRKTLYKGHQKITGIEVRNNYIDVPDKIKVKVQEEIKSGVEYGPYTQYFRRVQATNSQRP